MNAHRGDIVLLAYPFSDGSTWKVRPALVVQSDVYNAKLNSTIVALITKNTSRAANEPGQLFIDISTPEGSLTGLARTSAVVCTTLYTVHEKHLLKTLGRLPPNLMQKVDDCLKASLDLL